MTPATVVLLNGVGSVGKGAIATALQGITREPFLHVEMDSFLEMLPEALRDHPDGLFFERSERDGKPVVIAKTGSVAERALAGMRRAVAAMAAAGNNLIVDEVIFGDVETAYGSAVAEYRALLAPYRLFLVGVFAPLAVIEARERQRGDRLIGLARGQVDLVHRNMVYDLEIGASEASPAACAHAIKERFDL